MRRVPLFMRIFSNFLLFLAISGGLFGHGKVQVPQPLTPAEADAIVAAEAAAKEARYEARRAKLEGAEVVESRTVGVGERPVRINRVKPAALEKPASPGVAASPAQSKMSPEMSPEQWAAHIESRQVLIHEHISLGAKVFGDEHSEITWRDRETDEEFVVWTNVNLNYLSPVVSIRDGGYDYAYFGFVTKHTREEEKARRAFAAEKGFEVESRWKAPPVAFSGDGAEYVVVAEDKSRVPAKLYRQMDALLGYYLTNREALETRHHNVAVLREAREKYREANPPEPRETVVNFWRIGDE